ncbi:prolyl oligopeptidase family protein [Novosphingobium sp. PhB165]|uniref:alpha/beta hydrolase family protein n=1 Tax=Novosphingobium sp. PhB165 TaxID=2485105 RepID=UPI001050BF22|nr:prolyl oligopeptidase family serine peptidase [Novosphingobium sp. PhB165]TCM21463.1 prolyl oligopeptidase family protein [Novosphingobium sp. PhB165]
MKKMYLAAGVASVFFVLGGVAVAALPKVNSVFTEFASNIGRPGQPEVTIPAFGMAQQQKAQFFSAGQMAPLIVDLHQWSEDESGYAGNDEPLDKLVLARGWNFIRPALAGPNRTPSACCSTAVIDGIRAAIKYATENGKVDVSRIYVVGVSGGGYTALCAAASGKINARGFYAWASITDLNTWYEAHSRDHYGADVLQCTGSKGALNTAEANRRSPYFMPLSTAPVHIYAGVHDGFTGSVLPSHSIKMFNRYAQQYAPNESISPDAELRMLEGRRGPDADEGKTIGGRLIHAERQAGPASVVIFEGGHEMLARPMVEQIAKDAKSPR